MGKLTSLLVTALVALVCGFGGAFTAVSVFAEDLRGPQGATGVPGPAGLDGKDGAPGSDGAPGKRGPEGRPGRAAKTPVRDYNLGSTGCAGQSFRVVTDVKVVGKRLQVDRGQVCVVK